MTACSPCGRPTASAPTELRVVAHRWSARSHEMRDFLASNNVPVCWYLAEDPEGARLLTAAGFTADRLPVSITPEGETLVEPSNTELAAHVGLSATPATDFYDLVVIGGGPAGPGAAVYGASTPAASTCWCGATPSNAPCPTT